MPGKRRTSAEWWPGDGQAVHGLVGQETMKLCFRAQPRLLLRYSPVPDFRNSPDSIPVSKSVASTADGLPRSPFQNETNQSVQSLLLKQRVKECQAFVSPNAAAPRA